jgi:hypothetical protein
MPTYRTTHQYCNANIYDHSPVRQYQHIGPLTSIAVPTYMICWHCYTGEWSYMLVLLHWWVVLYVGIAILVSGPICWYCFTGEWSYMLALLYWWVVLYVDITTLVRGHIFWHCYTGEWSKHFGIAILVSDPHLLELLHWWVVPFCKHIYDHSSV